MLERPVPWATAQALGLGPQVAFRGGRALGQSGARLCLGGRKSGQRCCGRSLLAVRGAVRAALPVRWAPLSKRRGAEPAASSAPAPRGPALPKPPSCFLTQEPICSRAAQQNCELGRRPWRPPGCCLLRPNSASSFTQ